MSTNKKTVKTEKKNPLSTPLVVSMCLNAVLFLAVIIMGVYMAGNSGNNSVDTPAETNAPAETAATETESAEPTVYTFETDGGETVEVVAAPEAYILAAEYICAGDGSEWDFHYDEETNASTLVMTMDGVSSDFDINFYLTNDEENARLIAELYDEASESYSLWYLSNLLDEDGETFLGMVLQNATAVEDTTLLLCTPDYYEVYQAEIAATEE